MTLRLEQFTIYVVRARAVDNLCTGNVYYVFVTKKDPRNVLQHSRNVLVQRTFLNKSSCLMPLASYLCTKDSYLLHIFMCRHVDSSTLTNTKIDVFKPMTSIWKNAKKKTSDLFIFPDLIPKFHKNRCRVPSRPTIHHPSIPAFLYIKVRYRYWFNIFIKIDLILVHVAINRFPGLFNQH